MPDQKLCHPGQRSVELQEFDNLAAKRHGSSGLRTPSLRADCWDVSRVSAAFFAKGFDGKSSLCVGGGVAGASSLAAVLTTAAQSQPLAKQSLTSASAAAAVLASDSAAKASAISLKIAPRRGRPLKTVRAGPALVAAHAAVKSLETKEETNLELTKPQALPQEALKLANVKIASGNPSEYRGVRVRPGVKGFLVEIRPRRWKRTIWLGTYVTSPEAARAYDAGIFYTGKDIPFNFQDSKGSFPPLPEHLSLDDFDPDVMEEIKVFVKEKALEAAMRERVTTTQELLHTRKKVETKTSSVEVEEPCILSSNKMACENKDGHVKNEGNDGQDIITPNPFESLEPLPYNLPNCSEESLWNDMNFFVDSPLTAHDYKPQTGIFGDEDLDNRQQESCLMDGVLFDQCQQLVIAETGFKSVFVSKSNGNSGILNLDSWALECFDLAVQDPS